MRRLLLALLLVPALLLPAAGPAAADDLFEIDVRLEEAGFADAYTEAYDAVSGDGYRVSVDFSSASSTRAEYEQEARDAAEVLWQHLEGRLLAVDVAPTADVPWTPDGLPPAVSFVRADLQTAFGPRPAGLDDGDVHGAEELPLDDVDLGLDAGPGLAALAVLVLLLAVVGAVVTAVVLLRHRSAQRPAWGAASGAWPQGGGSQGAWPQGGQPGWEQARQRPEQQQGWQQGWQGPAQPGAGPAVPAGGSTDAAADAGAPARDPWAPPPGR